VERKGCGEAEAGRPGPRITAYYFFFAAFFFAAFFLAFFFAAIIVSFKVNLGMLHVRWLLRTPITRFFERCSVVSSIVLPKKFRKNRAWCGNSMPQLKKKATPLSSVFDDGIAVVCLPQHFVRVKRSASMINRAFEYAALSSFSS